MAAMPRTIGWGLVPNRGVDLAKRLGLIETPPHRPSIAEEVGMQKPGPGDYLRQLGPKTVDSMVAGYDRSLPREGREL